MVETPEERATRYKKQEIKRLIRKDYGYPVLQRLLAEAVYETRDRNKRSLKSRYNAILKILLGPPQKEINKKGYKNDEELLARVASITKSSFRKDPKTGKRLKKFLTISEACEEMARLQHVKGYKFQTQLPDNLNEGNKSEIRATKLRLLDKLNEKSVNDYARQGSQLGMLQSFEYEESQKEIIFIQSLIPDWLRRFGSQVRFEKK